MCSEIVTIAIGKMAMVSGPKYKVVLFEGPTRIERKIETRDFKPVSLEDRIKVHQAQTNCEDITTDNGKEERNDFEETFSFGVDEGGDQEGHDSDKGIFSNLPPSTKPAFLTADPASPRPITIIIGPMTTAGSNLSIQRVPATLTPAATST